VSMWKENRFGWPLRGHHLVHHRHCRVVCRHRSACRILADLVHRYDKQTLICLKTLNLRNGFNKAKGRFRCGDQKLK
jgi:hypothetical protein